MAISTILVSGSLSVDAFAVDKPTKLQKECTKEFEKKDPQKYSKECELLSLINENKPNPQIDSFFDVFFDVFTVDSFFDIFTDLRATDTSLQTQIDSFENQECDDGYYVYGIDEDGQIKCKPLSSGPSLSCGDNVVTAPETCDDGNTTSGDGCSATCSVEEACGNTNAVCSTSFTIPSVSGDLGNDFRTITDNEEKWYRLTIREDSDAFGQLPEAFILLEPENGDNYDLYVYCETCGGTLIGSSTFPSDLSDFFSVRSSGDDGIFANDDTFTVLIEVRAVSVNSCSDYTLTVQGNVIEEQYSSLGLC